MSTDKIKVIIVGEQFLFCQGIENALLPVEGIEVSGTAYTQNEVPGMIDASSPDVILLDIDGGSEDGLAFARKLKKRSPNTAVVVLTSNPNDADLFQALKSRASAYLSKNIALEELVSTIKQVARGECPINEVLTARPRVAQQVLELFQELSWQIEDESYVSPLTFREIEILNYIARGYLN